MSMPNVPDINPSVSLTRDDALNVILSSIGMEELSMAHLVNAEAEKIQFALGTLETANGEAASLEDIMKVNTSSNKMLRDVIKNQMLIGMKMEEVVSLAAAQDATTEAPVVPEEPTEEPTAEPTEEPADEPTEV